MFCGKLGQCASRFVPGGESSVFSLPFVIQLMVLADSRRAPKVMNSRALTLSRRRVLAVLTSLPLTSVAKASAQTDAWSGQDGQTFTIDGTYLDAAYTHPLGEVARRAALDYVESRRRDPQSISPRQNSRAFAVERFARLINAAVQDIAVVPSTMDAENLVNACLGVGPGVGVLTDAIHYDGSLVLYAELQRRGAPLAIVRPKRGRIDLADVREALTRDTRLIAVSQVSSSTGFEHDLAELCALAHSHGALVYADIIQAAGALPIDVRESQVDFAACGTYKWLMGDFGTAFLYVRPDVLAQIKRVEVGWRQVKDQESHVLPFEAPGPAIGPYTLAGGAAGIFEVSTPAWGALATVAGSLAYIEQLGVATLARHRQPLLDRLQSRLPALGFESLTPAGSRSPLVAFAYRNAEKRFAGQLKNAKIKISVYEHRIRVSPSIYNTLDDIDHLIEVLSA
jgi:selenocysteine lyase/cysteine desulfurase